MGTEPAARRARTRAGPGRPATRACGRALPFDSLYRHQAEAWEAAQRGEHVIVTTGTASGKTLAFNLPVARRARARAEAARALPLPDEGARPGPGARALAHSACTSLRPAIYDGDTQTERRWQIRKWANVILTNPDMLHVGILPHHDRWGDVLQNLRYVIVDEAHVYRGVFGSHVANVLRRLRRVARDLRRRAAVPARLGDDREPRRARAVAARRRRNRDRRGDAAPRAERTVAFWNPPLARRGARPARERARRGRAAARRPRRARPAHDLLRQVAQARPSSSTASPSSGSGDASEAERLAPYRAGYTPAAAARDRAAAGRRRAARRDGDRRARARHRHRPARLRDLGRLPRHGREPAPAVGPRRPPRPRARRPRRERGRARPVLHARARDAARAPGRGGDPRPRQPRVLDGHVLAAAYEAPLDDADSADARRRGPQRAPRSRRSCGKHEGAASSGAGATTRRRASPLRSTSPDSFTVVDAETGSVLGARRARARLLDRARGRRLPAPGRAVPRPRARPREPRRRWSSRSTATGTRRRRRRR